MSNISLYAEGFDGITFVPNIFIDEYMPSANGAYVKVYLYLLRSFSSKQYDLTISSIADHLEDTEKDIIRALKYWEKMNLLEIKYNSNKEITEIHMIPIHRPAKVLSEPLKIEPELDEIAVSIHTEPKAANKAVIPIEKIDLAEPVHNKGDIQDALHAAEVYLGRPLKATDTQLITYLYEELHFSAELIMYLYEYCVSINKKNSSYIEAVALSWAEEGIDTEEKAKAATIAYNEHVNAVNKAFGLNRAPGQIERQYIKKWMDVYAFPDEIITEACNRTILRTQKPDFKYTDKILENWFKKGVKTKADITKLDEAFTNSGKIYSDSTQSKTSTNKFNQFPQRNYSSSDYAELEKKLLNKSL